MIVSIYFSTNSVEGSFFSALSPAFIIIYRLSLGVGGGHTYGIWKFLDQGSNPYHSSNPSHNSDKAGSSTHCASGNPSVRGARGAPKCGVRMGEELDCLRLGSEHGMLKLTQAT